jgi:hypothetical protein
MITILIKIFFRANKIDEMSYLSKCIGYLNNLEVLHL